MAHLTVAGPTLDRVLELLASEPRRLTLRYLVESSDPVSVDDLVDSILEHTTVDHQASPQTVRLELYHHHLPKLEARGLVDYDRRSGDIRYYPDDRIERILACFPAGSV